MQPLLTASYEYPVFFCSGIVFQAHVSLSLPDPASWHALAYNATRFFGQYFFLLVPGFFSTDIEESVPTLLKLLQMCFAKEPPVEELYPALGYNVLVPPYVRQGLLSRSLDNDDLLPQIRKPVMITHGARDAAVLPAVVDQHKAVIRHAQVQMIQDAGHASFYEEPETFNRALREFIRSLG